MNYELFSAKAKEEMLNRAVINLNDRLAKIEEYIAHISSPEIEVKETKIETGKFYDYEDQKIYCIKDNSSKDGFYMFIRSNGNCIGIHKNHVDKLEPWDFKGEQPTVCPEIGKWYKTRGGDVVQITYTVESMRGPNYPFVININNNISGCLNYFGCLFNDSYTCADLIEEVPEPKEEIKLEVDSFWRTRDGKKVFINCKDEDGDFNGVIVGEDEWSTYSANGNVFNTSYSDCDIVAKWEG